MSDTSPIEILALVGVPGSGKSTFRRRWLREHPRYVAVSRDDLRAMLRAAGKILPSDLENVVTTVVEAAIAAALAANYSVVVDNTHVREWSLRRLLGTFPHVPMRVHVVDTPLAQAEAWNAERTGTDYVPVNIIRDMHAQLEKLQQSAFWEREIAPRLLPTEQLEIATEPVVTTAAEV